MIHPQDYRYAVAFLLGVRVLVGAFWVGMACAALHFIVKYW